MFERGELYFHIFHEQSIVNTKIHCFLLRLVRGGKIRDVFMAKRVTYKFKFKSKGLGDLF